MPDHVGQVGVLDVGPLALEDVQVGPADPGAADLDDDVEGTLELRFGDVVDRGVGVVLVHADGLHGWVPFETVSGSRVRSSGRGFWSASDPG